MALHLWMMWGNKDCLFLLKGNSYFATWKDTTNLKVYRRTKSFLRRFAMDNNIVSLDYLSQLRWKSFNRHATKDVRIDQDYSIIMRSNIVYHTPYHFHLPTFILHSISLVYNVWKIIEKFLFQLISILSMVALTFVS